MMGAVGLWVGTRCVASEEAGCSPGQKEAVVGAGRGEYGEDVGGYWEAVVGEEEWVCGGLGGEREGGKGVGGEGGGADGAGYGGG